MTRSARSGTGEAPERVEGSVRRIAGTGPKSSALELTNISVAMKVAIEQMREQVQNIE